MGKLIKIFLIIILILVLTVSAFGYYILRTPNYKTENIPNPFLGENIIINETHVSYLVNAMGAHYLKSSFGDTPKIEVWVDGEKYSSEIDEGMIQTRKAEIENEDIVIITSKEEMQKIALSQNPKQTIQDSVSSGKTEIKMIAGYSKLFAKGYLNIYKDITGKSLTGNIIKAFS